MHPKHRKRPFDKRHRHPPRGEPQIKRLVEAVFIVDRKTAKRPELRRFQPDPRLVEVVTNQQLL